MVNIIKIISIWITLVLVQCSYAQLQIGSDIDGESAGDGSGRSVSMPNKYTVAIGARFNDDGGSNAGHARVFSWDGSSWVQKGNDIDGTAPDDWFGYAVSMPDENTIAIGSPKNDPNAMSVDAGKVEVYTWNGTNWIQKGLSIGGGDADNQAGSSVSMADSNTLAIGVPGDDNPNGTAAGAVRVYEWDGSNWNLKGSSIEGESSFYSAGDAVSMPNPETVAIGESSGNQVRIFEWNGTSWVQKGNNIDGEANQDYFGSTLSMPDTNTIAVGAYANDGNGPSAGHVRVFSWDGSDWIQKGTDIDGDANNDFFGWSVSMGDSNILAAGAYNSLNQRGKTSIYEWNGSSWSKKITDITGEWPDDEFGYSVSMVDTNTVAIGAPLNDDGGSNAGHASIFDLCSEKVTDQIVACDSLNWIDGNTYTSSTSNASYTLANEAGCDSLVELDLTINSSSAGIDQVNVCDALTWIDGNTYTASTNAPTYNLTNAQGCDSVVTLNLTIPTIDTTTFVNGITIESNENNGSYQWLDCDNNFTPIQGEIYVTYNASSGGNYAVEIEKGGCKDTSNCVPISAANLYESGTASFKIYPNPVRDKLYFEKNGMLKSVTIYNAIGVKVSQLEGNLSYFKTKSLDSGVYFFEFHLSNKILKKKVIVSD